MKLNHLTSKGDKIISRFHRIIGTGEPEALHTASTLPPFFTVTLLGFSSTLGTTAIKKNITRHNISHYVSIFRSNLYVLMKPNNALHYHSLVEWVWQSPLSLLFHQCMLTLDCRCLLGVVVWSTSSHKYNPEGFQIEEAFKETNKHIKDSVKKEDVGQLTVLRKCVNLRRCNVEVLKRSPRQHWEIVISEISEKRRTKAMKSQIGGRAVTK